jgi:sigma-E factor negative regulatory protein RseA
MSEDKLETLSAFIDGEVAEDVGKGLLEQLLVDASLHRRWRSYHLIGDTMRRHLPEPAGLSVSARVREALSTESAAVHVLPVRKRPSVHPLAGLAVAASVAMAAILGLYALLPLQSQPLETASSAPAVGGAYEATGSAAPVVKLVHNTGERGSLDEAATRLTWNDAAPGVANRLNGYLVTHNEYLVNGMRGMLPYARIVAYDGRRN